MHCHFLPVFIAAVSLPYCYAVTVLPSGQALSQFELVGNGRCAISTNCNDWGCVNSYFSRYTDSSHLFRNSEDCAHEAIQFGAIAFTVADGRCNLIPEVDPGLDDGTKCPSSSHCPARSPYGSYFAYDWEWYSHSGGVSPVLGVYPDDSLNCYKKAEVETALGAFELLGIGRCAISTNCTDWGCTNSYFARYTDSAHSSTIPEDCAQEAVQFGAQGFTVAGARCLLIPQDDPDLDDGTKCPSSPYCPPRSNFGSYKQYDWEWYLHAGGVSPILGVYPGNDIDSYFCYRKGSVVDACDSNPCQNSGFCTDLPSGAADATGRTCACGVGFTGNSCETEVETALSGFEFVGEGKCAISENCDDFVCMSSFFYRHTDSEHYSTNAYKCAREAEEFGAQGFYVNNNGHHCNLIPQDDPGLENGDKCPSVSACPPKSPYGSYNQYDWEWYDFGGNVLPILGVYPTSSFSCYKRGTEIAEPSFTSCKAVDNYFKQNRKVINQSIGDVCNSVAGCRAKKNKCKKLKCTKLSETLCISNNNLCRLVTTKSGTKKCKNK